MIRNRDSFRPRIKKRYKDYKDKTMAYVLWALSFHRIYFEKYTSGIIMLLCALFLDTMFTIFMFLEGWEWLLFLFMNDKQAETYEGWWSIVGLMFIGYVVWWLVDLFNIEKWLKESYDETDRWNDEVDRNIKD